MNVTIPTQILISTEPLSLSCTCLFRDCVIKVHADWEYKEESLTSFNVTLPDISKLATGLQKPLVPSLCVLRCPRLYHSLTPSIGFITFPTSLLPYLLYIRSLVFLIHGLWPDKPFVPLHPLPLHYYSAHKVPSFLFYLVYYKYLGPTLRYLVNAISSYYLYMRNPYIPSDESCSFLILELVVYKENNILLYQLVQVQVVIKPFLA